MKTMTTSHTQPDSDAPAPFAGDRSHAGPQLVLRCLGVLRRARDLGDAEIAGAVHDLLIDWHSRGDRLRAADQQIAAMRTYQSTLLDDIREMKQEQAGIRREQLEAMSRLRIPPEPSPAPANVEDATCEDEPMTEVQMLVDRIDRVVDPLTPIFGWGETSADAYTNPHHALDEAVAFLGAIWCEMRGLPETFDAAICELEKMAGLLRRVRSGESANAVVCEALGKIEPKAVAREPVPMPVPLKTPRGLAAAECRLNGSGEREIVCYTDLPWVPWHLRNEWLCRAVAWVNDGEGKR